VDKIGSHLTLLGRLMIAGGAGMFRAKHGQWFFSLRSLLLGGTWILACTPMGAT